MKSFKSRHSFQERAELYKKEIKYHPSKVAIVAEKHSSSTLMSQETIRYMADPGDKIGYIKKVLSKKIVDQDKVENGALFLVLGNKILTDSQETLGDLNDQFQEPDGYLYIGYSDMEPF